uniref:Uncharacterized protein n=1 Tax=Bos taurus TaxID=9913 RepID=A0ABI0NKZ1_BOVIN
MPRSHPVSPRMPVGLQISGAMDGSYHWSSFLHSHPGQGQCRDTEQTTFRLRFLEPWSGVITGHPFFIPILDRVSAEIRNKPPSDWERLVPPLLVTQHLLSCRLHLCICPGLDTQKHTHKHSQHKHMCVYTHAWHGDTNANRECRCFRS